MDSLNSVSKPFVGRKEQDAVEKVCATGLLDKSTGARAMEGGSSVESAIVSFHVAANTESSTLLLRASGRVSGVGQRCHGARTENTRIAGSSARGTSRAKVAYRVRQLSHRAQNTHCRQEVVGLDIGVTDRRSALSLYGNGFVASHRSRRVGDGVHLAVPVHPHPRESDLRTIVDLVNDIARAGA